MGRMRLNWRSDEAGMATARDGTVRCACIGSSRRWMGARIMWSGLGGDMLGEGYGAGLRRGVGSHSVILAWRACGRGR